MIRKMDYAEAEEPLERLLEMARAAIDRAIMRIKEEKWNI